MRLLNRFIFERVVWQNCCFTAKIIIIKRGGAFCRWNQMILNGIYSTWNPFFFVRWKLYTRHPQTTIAQAIPRKRFLIILQPFISFKNEIYLKDFQLLEDTKLYGDLGFMILWNAFDSKCIINCIIIIRRCTLERFPRRSSLFVLHTRLSRLEIISLWRISHSHTHFPPK